MLGYMKLTATRSSFRPPHEGDRVRQSVTVKRDGHCWVSEYEWRDMDIRCSGTESFFISSEKAAEVLDAVEKVGWDSVVHIMDGGEFDLLKRYADGREERIYGNGLCTGGISKFIREKLGREDLLLFDC